MECGTERQPLGSHPILWGNNWWSEATKLLRKGVQVCYVCVLIRTLPTLPWVSGILCSPWKAQEHLHLQASFCSNNTQIFISCAKDLGMWNLSDGIGCFLGIVSSAHKGSRRGLWAFQSSSPYTSLSSTNPTRVTGYVVANTGVKIVNAGW